MGNVGEKYWDVEYEACGANKKREKEEGSRVVDEESRIEGDGDSRDPQYMGFLANLKPHGKSYVVKAGVQNGVPLFLKYENEDGSDDVLTTTDRESQIHGVGKFTSRKVVKTNKNSSIVEKQEKDGMRRENKDFLGKRKHKQTQIMDKGVKIESKEDTDCKTSLPFSIKPCLRNEEIPQSEVEILENVDAGGSFNPFVPSVQRCQNLEGPCCNQNIDSGYRKEVLKLLMRPYDEEEYKKLWKDIKIQITTYGGGKSLLSLHKAVNREIKNTNHDKDKKLNIMRGFFFWLEHLTRQDAFKPWEDAECLRTMPGSTLRLFSNINMCH